VKVDRVESSTVPKGGNQASIASSSSAASSMMACFRHVYAFGVV